MKKFKLFVTTLIILTLGCTEKPGTGGKNTLVAIVKHHGLVIPNATVYIKYGSTEFPGENTSLYDDYKTAGSDGRVEFRNLKRGDYYLYGVGFDNAINQTVVGGIPVQLFQKAGEKLIDLPVTEGD
jgi:hypothetical protein